MNKNDKVDIAKGFWKKVMATVEIDSESAAYGTLFANITPKTLTENTLFLTCKNEFIKLTLEKNTKVILEAMRKVGKTEYKLETEIEKKELVQNGESFDSPLFKPQRNQNEVLVEKRRKAGLNRKYTFENYIMGRNNQMAYAVATAVAEKPGEVYNPVFLYSGVGLGKTHLMQAIGNKIIANKPGTKVVYTTGEAFTNELIDSIQKRKGSHTPNEFRNKFRKADVFLIDDIQFIIGRGATTEEFFHTFNALHMEQKQIIITSDRPPKDFDKLEDRITSRFSSGIIVDIQQPDLDMRVAILRNKRDAGSDPIADEVIDFIAQSVDTNVREMEGAYLQVLTHAHANNIGSITLEQAAEAMHKNLKDSPVKNVNMNQILNAVCNYYSVKSADIKGKRRTKTLVVPRQIAMYLIQDITQTPFMTIGEFLGGRDHSTVIHGVDKIKKEVGVSMKTKQDVSNIKQIVWGN
jgi:chromosomal replication initiator protein